jgi:hypothetical protein
MRALGLASAAAGRVTARAPRGRRPLRWYIMTSAATDAATRAFFERHAWFGLRREQVAFFQQGELPCLTPEGRLILERPGRLARAPDGNGGLYAALAECALAPCMASRPPPASRKREIKVHRRMRCTACCAMSSCCPWRGPDMAAKCAKSVLVSSHTAGTLICGRAPASV